MTSRVALFLSALTVSLGCNGPLVLLPGGALAGPTAPAPGSWDLSDDVKTVQLETLPAAPYSVNLWVIALGESLYVHAGTNRAQWVENLEADARVRVRVAGAIYELAGARVTEQGEFDRFSDAYKRKYGLRPRNENAREAYLFRLAAR